MDLFLASVVSLKSNTGMIHSPCVMLIELLFTVPVTSNASRHFKSPLAMGEMPFKIKRASSVPISVVIDTGVNSKKNVLWYILFLSWDWKKRG